MATLTITHTIASPNTIAGTQSPNSDASPTTNRSRTDTERKRASKMGCLEKVHNDLQQGRGKQDLDDRLIELLEELPPDRFAGRGVRRFAPNFARLSPTSASVSPAARQLGKSSAISRSERMSTSW